jgi:DNA-binding NtrC family response regulator
MAGKILIVDDEKNIRTSLTLYLENLGYGTDSTASGNEALKLLKNNTGEEYELVLLDIKMQGLTGLQVLAEIRNMGIKTDVIMMTAYGTIENAVESMKLGALDFLNKPFTLESLKSVIDNAIKRKDLKASEIKTFQEYLEFGKKCIVEKNFDKAKEYLKKAIAENLEAPEPQNLIGVLYEYGDDILTAGKHYRAALELDPTYKPALENLDRVTRFRYSKDGLKFGDED